MNRFAPPTVRVPDTCRRCGQALPALARRRGDLCDSMDCRRLEADERARARRTSALDAARSAAANAWNDPALAAAPVLWLRHHAEGFEPPEAVDVAELRAALTALEADERPAPRAWSDAPAASADGHLCALCRGHCCALGLGGKAFLEPHHLRGWLAQRYDATWADAVDHYLAFVPAEHLQGSCLFHGERGCALPRERRSDVCNGFACDALERWRGVVAADPAAVVAVGIVEAQELRSAARVSAQGSTAMALIDAPAK